MAPLAIYMKQAGFSVTGTDVSDRFITDEVLEQAKIPILTNFLPSHITRRTDVVIATGAHGGKTNPEVRKALKLGIPVFMHGQMLGNIMSGKEGVAVSGCHGKTTTASALAFLLSTSGFDPSYSIGTSTIIGLGPAGHHGSGNIFIAEADEYMTCPVTDPTPRFLWQKPKMLIITNIEYDHPDAFPTFNDVKNAFLRLTENVDAKGTVIACIDNRHVRELLPFIKRNVVTYGFSKDADFRIYSFSLLEGVSFMKVANKTVEIAEFMLNIAGKHNMLNLLAASVAANFSGCSWEKIKANIKNFQGSKRRFEKIEEVADVLFYDDYAHHPSEIRATLAACRNWYPKRYIIVLFQPHTFSRTKILFKEFATSFSDCDEVIVTDIYPSAREAFDPTISSKLLVAEIKKIKKQAMHLPGKVDAVAYLKKHYVPKSIVMTMGAGDIYKWHDDLIPMYKAVSL